MNLVLTKARAGGTAPGPFVLGAGALHRRVCALSPLGKHRPVSRALYGGRVPLIHYEVPDELHRRSKAKAAERGITLKEFILQALQREVDRTS